MPRVSMLRRAFPVAILLALASGTWPDPRLRAAESISLDDMAGLLNLTEQEKAELRTGEIVRREVEETSEKEIAGLVVLLLPEPIDRIAERARRMDLLKTDPQVIAFGLLGDDGPSGGTMEDLTFGADEADEIRKLSEVEAGAGFNLSRNEIETFQAVSRRYSGRCGRGTSCFAALNAAWREMLLSRLAAYRHGGLAALAPYDRGGGVTANPADGLRSAAESLTLLREEMPSLYRAFLEYPASQVEGVTHEFIWKKGTVQDRPTFSLGHRMVSRNADGFIVLYREFYVGQSYNSLQTAIGAFPLRDQTALVYLDRVSTDQAAGFGSSMRHGIGRRMMFKQIEEKFEACRSDMRR